MMLFELALEPLEQVKASSVALPRIPAITLPSPSRRTLRALGLITSTGATLPVARDHRTCVLANSTIGRAVPLPYAHYLLAQMWVG